MISLGTYRHKKLGTLYDLIAIGKMQAQDAFLCDADGRAMSPGLDMQDVAIYRAHEDNTVWVRMLSEFEDGRFERVGV